MLNNYQAVIANRQKRKVLILFMRSPEGIEDNAIDGRGPLGRPELDHLMSRSPIGIISQDDTLHANIIWENIVRKAIPAGRG